MFRFLLICALSVMAWGSFGMDAATRVKRAKELLAAGKPYPKGCSEFICELLQVTYEQADTILGNVDNFNLIKKRTNEYFNVNPGDIVGFKKGSSSGSIVADYDHVAIYIGEPGMMFIDVPGLGKNPRKLQGYGALGVWKSKKY